MFGVLWIVIKGGWHYSDIIYRLVKKVQRLLLSATDYWMYKFRDVRPDNSTEDFHGDPWAPFDNDAKSPLQLKWNSYLSISNMIPTLLAVFFNANCGHKFSFAPPLIIGTQLRYSIYFLHSEKIIQMPLKRANGNQSKNLILQSDIFSPIFNVTLAPWHIKELNKSNMVKIGDSGQKYGIYSFKVETFVLKRHQVNMFPSTFSGACTIFLKSLCLLDLISKI